MLVDIAFFYGKGLAIKKIGICTLHFGNNFGAVLQAFSLQEVLKSMGHEVEFIKLKDFKPTKQAKNVELFNKSRESLNISEKMYEKDLDKYDAIIIGSDELWNLKNGSFEHLEEYFGYNLNADKIASYAPSANGVTAQELIEYYDGKVDFSKFNKLSARDKVTQKLIKDVSGIDAPLVLDPTLLIDSFEKYTKYPENDEKDYIVIYGYEFSDEEISKIMEFAKSKNKKVYSLGFEKDWCDALKIDIFEFLGYMKNADYCITNTFHGLLFAMILEKEFVVFPNTNAKVHDIIDRFGITERNGMYVEDLNEIFDNKVDYERINKFKLEKREESLEYLRNFIG